MLAVIAALADGRGAHALAFDALLGAIPFAAVATLVAFGSYLERREHGAGGLQALLWTLALTMLVLSCAARSPATQMHTLPPLAASALVAALAVFALKAVVAATPYARLALRPAKP
ncbi:MAG TPA: hypothetical protein VIJ70_05645 [Gaiellaceae bacterium]